VADLSPDAPTHATHNFDKVADNDTLGWLILAIDLYADNWITASLTLRCYDSNAADGQYLNGWLSVDGENYTEARLNIPNTLHQS